MKRGFKKGAKKYLISFLIIFMLALIQASDYGYNNRPDESFLDLQDTPNTYSSDANKCAVVNSEETRLEFVDCGNSSALFNSSKFSDIWITAEGFLDDAVDIFTSFLTNDLNWAGNASNCADGEYLDGNNFCQSLNTSIDEFTKSTTYLAENVSTISGTYTDGNVSSLWVAEESISNSTYNVTEAAGANPLTIQVNFTGVVDFNSMIIREWYQGGSGHEMKPGLYDCTGGTYEEEYGEYTDMDSYAFSLINVLDPSEHICSEVVSLQLRHEQTGNPAHSFSLDYAVLVDGFSTITTTEHDSLSGRDDRENHPWAMPKNSSENFTTLGWGEFGTLNVTGNIYIESQGYCVGNFSVNNSDLFVDTSTGRVGIGTDNPQAPFHIETDTSPAMFIKDLNGDTQFQLNILPDSGGELEIYNGIGSGDVRISARSGSNSWINNAGNFGIGTTDPSNKLDVVGSGNFSGNLNVEGNITAYNISATNDISGNILKGDFIIGETELIVGTSTGNDACARWRVAGIDGEVTYNGLIDVFNIGNDITTSGWLQVGGEILALDAGFILSYSEGSDKYTEMSHNDSDGIINVSSGDLRIIVAGGDVVLNNNTNLTTTGWGEFGTLNVTGNMTSRDVEIYQTSDAPPFGVGLGSNGLTVWGNGTEAEEKVNIGIDRGGRTIISATKAIYFSAFSDRAFIAAAAGLSVAQDKYFRFGDSTNSHAQFEFDNDQSKKGLVLFLDNNPDNEKSNSLIVTGIRNYGFDFNFPEFSEPTVCITSNENNTESHMCLSHNNDTALINSGKGGVTINSSLNVTGTFQAADYYSGDNSQGITDASSYWLCDANDCSSTCQVDIKDGLIVGCT